MLPVTPAAGESAGLPGQLQLPEHGHGYDLSYCDACEVLFAPRKKAMVEAMTLVGICAGESSETRVSERWCEMDFVHPQHVPAILAQIGKLEMSFLRTERACQQSDCFLF